MSKIKVCILGYYDVGKTTLSLMYAMNGYDDCYSPNIDRDFIKTIYIDGESYTACITEEGFDDFKEVKTYMIKRSVGFILVYSVERKDTVEELKENFDLIKEHHKNIKNIIILGNKADIPKDEWMVSKRDVKEMIKEWGEDFPIFEVSAKTGLGVSESIDTLFRTIVNNNKPKEEEKEKGEEKGGGEEEGGCCNIQ